MHPQAIRVMQRFVGTPLGQTVVQLFIAWLVLQPLWEVGQRTARDTTPLLEVVAWIGRLVHPGAAHAAPVTETGPEHTLPGARPLSLLPDDASTLIATAPSLFAATLEHHISVAAATDAPPAGATTSFTGALTVFGPKDYVRSRGAPVTITDTFRVTAPLATATLRVTNRGMQGQYAPVSSAVITLNGTVVVAPNAFNPQVTVIEKPVPLLSQNILSVEVQSEPDSGFTLQILGLRVNTPPIAHAGSDQTVLVGATVTLDGSRSTDSDGDPLTYAWALEQRPASSTAVLQDPTAVHPTFQVDAPGTYLVRLLGHDGQAESAPAVVAITTTNSAPVADAGSDQTAFVTRMVTLDGSKSSDVDGDLLTYHWSLSSPTTSQATLSDAQAVKPTLVVDVPGTYQAQLVVHDGHVPSSSGTVTITTVNSPPVADAGLAQTVFVTQTVTLDGSKSSDVDGDLLTYHWSLSSQPATSQATLSDAQAVKPTFVADVHGTYVAQLIVHDGHVPSTPATVTIVTTNVPPVANAGPDQAVFVGQIVPLDGSQSRDVDQDTLTFRWSFAAKPPGSMATLADAGTITPTFQVDLHGDYVVQLIVHDGHVDSTPDTVVISTINSKPVANAGPDSQVTVGDTVHLDGQGSSDADGDALTFLWDILTMPTNSSARLADPTAHTLTFDADLAGTYVLQLIVSDGLEDSPPDTVTVTAIQPNRPPVITSTPLTMATVGQPYSYGVQATDPDAEDTLTFTLPTAPTGMTIDATTGLIQWTPTSTQVGDQPVTVRVHDAEGLAATQSFTITVPQPNRPPLITSSPGTTATAGQPYSYAVAATDPDAGDVLTFALPTAPAGMTIHPSTGLIQWTPDMAQAGSQPVTVRVQDQGGLMAEQSFTLAVGLPPVNHPSQITSTPLTAASAEQPYSYDVEATDPDAGDVLAFALLMAPTGMTIDAATGLIQWIPTQFGTHEVMVRVHDTGGLFVTQSFTILVAAPANRPPVAVDDTYDAPRAGEIVLDFDDGQLPSAHGWTYGSDCTGSGFPGGVVLPEGQALRVADGLLHLDTTGPATTFVDAFYARTGLLDATRTQVFEARLRVLAAEPAPPDTTQAFALYLNVGRRSHYVQIGDGEIHTFPAVQGGVSALIDTTQFHTYTLVRPAGSTSTYTVLVDGVPLLQATAVVELPDLNLLWFGDGTCQSCNGRVEIDFVRFRQFEDNGTIRIPAPGVLGNDNDPDGDPLTAVLMTGPAHGTLTLTADGAFTYTPQSGFSGTDSFTYTANDGRLDSNPATVTISVSNHAPIITSMPHVSRWMPLHPTGTPPKERYWAGANAYDVVNDRLILFSGEDNSDIHPHPADVWVLVNASGVVGPPSWIQLQPINSGPGGRMAHTVVYDVTSNRLIIHGGCFSHCGFHYSDTWVLTNANGLGGAPAWIPLPSTIGRSFQATGYDHVSNRLIEFGGLTGGPGSDTNDVRVLIDANGIGTPTWITLAPMGTPPPAHGHSATGTYDPISNRLIIFGGYTSNNTNTPLYNDTWVLTNANGLGGTPT